MKMLSLLPKIRFPFFWGRYYSQGRAKQMKSKILEKYPNVISSEDLNKILEICSNSQTYSNYPKNLELEKKIQEEYPHKMEPEKLNQVLKEAEVTRKKFSVY